MRQHNRGKEKRTQQKQRRQPRRRQFSTQDSLRRQDSRQQMRQQNTRQQSVNGSSHHQNSKARCSDRRRNIPTFPILWHKDATDTVKPSSRHPGTVPYGLTNSPRRNARYQNKLQQHVFF
jgi:hypothetical protein